MGKCVYGGISEMVMCITVIVFRSIETYTATTTVVAVAVAVAKY